MESWGAERFPPLLFMHKSNLALWFTRSIFIVETCFVLLLHTYLLIVLQNCDFTSLIVVVLDLYCGTLMQCEMYIATTAWSLLNVSLYHFFNLQMTPPYYSGCSVLMLKIKLFKWFKNNKSNSVTLQIVTLQIGQLSRSGHTVIVRQYYLLSDTFF